jgi:hypothetical protein
MLGRAEMLKTQEDTSKHTPAAFGLFLILQLQGVRVQEMAGLSRDYR